MKRAADLFAGVGGFHFGARAAGCEVVWASEIDPHAARQYAAATGLEPAGDIRAVRAEDIPDHDLLTAGVPCQPYSIIGKGGGLDDPRGAVVEEVFRVLDAKRPEAVVLENVRRLETYDGGRALAYIRGVLEALGYSVRHRVLNALSYGLPQRRERLFIVGRRGGMHGFEWPLPLARPLLAALLEKDVPPGYRLTDYARESLAVRHTAEGRPMIWHENKSGRVSSHEWSCALRADASANYLSVDGERHLTEREMLRLQGFPDSFPICGSYAQIRRQAGNAVPVSMAAAVIGAVLGAPGEPDPVTVVKGSVPEGHVLRDSGVGAWTDRADRADSWE